MTSGLSLPAWPWLGLLLLVPAGLWFAHHRRRRLVYPGLSDGLPVKRRTLWSLWPDALRAVALGLVAIALAGPLRSVERVVQRAEGVTIQLAFDISSSMLAEDFRPDNRIAVARREVARFVENRETDRIGLVAFAGEALTVVPGTLDHDVVLRAVENLNVGQLTDGTAIGTALATAVNRLRESADGSRVVVLLTDGDNNRGVIDPVSAASAAAALGIRVYTIGIGRDGVVPVPIGRTRFGYQYANMEVTVNDELLTRVAEQTGGVYFRATDPEALQRIYERIDELETSPLREERFTETAAVRRELVFVALLALLLELVGAAGRARRSLA
ncbi:MAG: vWA domain-containing protein [Gemmatimonadota bacterium]